jgi:hypothetical protein
MTTDGFLQIPADSVGKKLRTLVLPDGEHAEAIVVVDAAGNLVSSPESPKASTLTSANLAAGASITLQAAAITTATTGQLISVLVAASVPLKAEIQSVSSGTPTTRAVLFTTDARLTADWTAPHKDWFQVAGGATSRYQVILTNQDNIDTADVYCTIFWDEVS